MKKAHKIIYYITTGIFSLLILAGVITYFSMYEMVSEMYKSLGFPTFIIYPLAIAKILGLVAIWTNKSKMLKEWAYAGFVFELMLGVGAHINAGDGEFLGALLAFLLVGTSYFFSRKRDNIDEVGA